jgi:hypothetical protein
MVEEASRRNFSGRLSFYLTKQELSDRILGEDTLSEVQDSRALAQEVFFPRS